MDMRATASSIVPLPVPGAMVPGAMVLAAMVLGAGAASAVAQDGSSIGRKGDWEITIRPKDTPKKKQLVRYRIVGDAIPKSLTGRPGNALRGKALAADRDEGNCLACHSIPIPEEPFHGTLGPDLRGIGARMTAGQIRLRLVNPRKVNPRTMMPPYYVVSGRHRVRKDVRDRPILEAQDIEDIVAFMMTMTR